ncbi:MAG: NAD-dependent epimerase/dehydratase family protein [Candidatus Omnitrophota bacterium]
MDRFLDGKRVFLAGATGLAGTSILNYILKYYPQTKIRAAYYKHTKPFLKHKNIDYCYADLRSENDCGKIVRDSNCAIMAAAYSGGAGFVISSPLNYISENLVMNVRLLQAFHSAGIKRIIYISSATLYQEFNGHIKEKELDLNKEPAGAYQGFGWVARYIERFCDFLHTKYGSEILIARVANIFGPYSKFDFKTSHFISALIRKAVEKQDPFEIWGRPDVIRDVIFSEDFGRAIVTMMDAEKIKFDIFNIGSGIQITVDEIAKLILKSAGHNPCQIRYNHDKPSTVKFRALDCSKAKEALGWQTQNSIEQGIQKTVEWWIENKGWWTK